MALGSIRIDAGGVWAGTDSSNADSDDPGILCDRERRENGAAARGAGNPDAGGKVVQDLGKETALARARAGDALQVLKPQISRKMVHEVLKAVVDRQGGTARRARIEGYEVFGKTGTAQVAVNGKYVDGKYVSSFMAGAPAWAPRICVLVMVREPDRSLGLGYTGGVVAAPAVKEILRQTLPYLGVEKKLEGENEGDTAVAAVN